MTRRLLAIFAPSLLAAQVRKPRPDNGQCPVCGTWKWAYFVSKGEKHFNMGATNSRRVDCDYCGCTFRQWAEGKEPKR